MSIQCTIKKDFGDFSLNINLCAGNEVMGLLGPSGCGKSMTLKCIAGVVKPDDGRIVLDGKVLFDHATHTNLAPQSRRVGFLFQNYALFPHMTVRDNIRMGARRERKTARGEKHINDIMERFEIAALANHYPAQLSGGQQQRTALARILVSEPEILLLDEPFSALDTHLRFRLERELRAVTRQFGKTVLLVSHDRDEIFRMADRIAIMNKGRIDVCGDKAQVFQNPSTCQAAILTGCKNISACCANGPRSLYATDWGISLETASDPSGFEAVGVRMHDVLYGEGENAHRFEVLEEIEIPFSVTVMVRPEGHSAAIPLGWEADKALWQAVRAKVVTLHIPKEHVMLLH